MKPKTSRWEEHGAGWDVMENDTRLFSLDFIGTDQPFYRFEVSNMNYPKERVIEILNSAGRQPIKDIVYKNRLSLERVPDEMFCGGYHDEVAGIRDFRPCSPWVPGGPHRQLLLLGVMLIIIVLLLVLESGRN